MPPLARASPAVHMMGVQMNKGIIFAGCLRDRSISLPLPFFPLVTVCNRTKREVKRLGARAAILAMRGFKSAGPSSSKPAVGGSETATDAAIDTDATADAAIDTNATKAEDNTDESVGSGVKGYETEGTTMVAETDRRYQLCLLRRLLYRVAVRYGFPTGASHVHENAMRSRLFPAPLLIPLTHSLTRCSDPGLRALVSMGVEAAAARASFAASLGHRLAEVGFIGLLTDEDIEAAVASGLVRWGLWKRGGGGYE